jgi:anthranilate phosphoribosyltransferase
MRGPKRDIAIVNAAVGLMAGGLAQAPKEAMEKVAEAIDSGRAKAVLAALQERFAN